MTRKILLCQLQDFDGEVVKKIPHPLKTELDLILIKNNRHYYAYHNVCPHFSIQLDNAKGQFFTYDNQWIMCAHHSAMFEISSGLCVEGPCKARQLIAEKISIENGKIYLQDCSENMNS
jgi:nitrite reductase/ring-hydroxylating ferredoxin subunit